MKPPKKKAAKSAAKKSRAPREPAGSEASRLQSLRDRLLVTEGACDEARRDRDTARATATENARVAEHALAARDQASLRADAAVQREANARGLVEIRDRELAEVRGRLDAAVDRAQKAESTLAKLRVQHDEIAARLAAMTSPLAPLAEPVPAALSPEGASS